MPCLALIFLINILHLYGEYGSIWVHTLETGGPHNSLRWHQVRVWLSRPDWQKWFIFRVSFFLILVTYPIEDIFNYRENDIIPELMGGHFPLAWPPIVWTYNFFARQLEKPKWVLNLEQESGFKVIAESEMKQIQLHLGSSWRLSLPYQRTGIFWSVWWCCWGHWGSNSKSNFFCEEEKSVHMWWAQGRTGLCRAGGEKPHALSGNLRKHWSRDRACITGMVLPVLKSNSKTH